MILFKEGTPGVGCECKPDRTGIRHKVYQFAGMRMNLHGKNLEMA